MKARLTPAGTILVELPPAHPKYAALFESLTGHTLLEGFTGIDSHGHKWVNGEQVRRDDLGPDDGEGSHAAARFAKLSEPDNRLRGSSVWVRERPADEVFRGEHRQAVESDVVQVLAGAMPREAAPSLAYMPAGGMTVVHTGGGEVEASVKAFIEPGKDGAVKLTGEGINSNTERSVVIRPEDSRELRALKIRHAFGIKLSAEEKDQLRAAKGGGKAVHESIELEEDGYVQESLEPDLAALVDTLLLEAGYSGTLVDKAGHKRTYRDGKQVAGAEVPTPSKQRPAAHELAGVLAGVKPTEGDAREAEAKAGSAWQQLSDGARRTLATMYAGGKVLAHHAETSYRVGRNVALAVAQERGASPEQAERLGKIIGAADAILGWTVNFPVVTALTGNPLTGKASSWLPVASMGYIAYSGLRNPIKTVRAAARTLSSLDVLKGGHKAVHESIESTPGIEALAADLLGKLEERGDWYEALVVVALDITHDLGEAIGLADQAFAASAVEPDEDLVDEAGK